MVELTEIDEDIKDFGSNLEQNNISTDGKDISDDEYSSDDEDDFYENETLCQRICALKDIIPPKQRKAIFDILSSTASIFQCTFSKGGNLLWALTTSALLLGVPLSLSILAEQQLIEMEKSFDLQGNANDILAAGDAKSSTPI